MTALPLADPLIDLQALIPDAVLDIRYATKDNLTGRPLYPFAAAFLRRSAAEKLAKAASELRTKGLRLVIYDAYRPLAAQKALWKAKPDARFVADPKKGSSHNRGGAVDAALADADRPPGVRPEARRNAVTLMASLESPGFVSLADEWWHYRDREALSWPVLDIPFEQVTR